jgi:hypothetical protein
MTVAAALEAVQDADCPMCEGSGIGGTVAVCCRRAGDYCGGNGCCGPQPEPVPCEHCGGSGKMAILPKSMLA